MRSTSIKWMGREVHSPIGRKAVVAIVVPWALFWCALIVVYVVAMIPVVIILHPLLRLAGRRGTIRMEGTTFHFGLDDRAFGRQTNESTSDG